MNLTTNIQHYPEWTAYLKDRQPKTLIVWGRNDPLILPAAAEFVKQVVAGGRPALFRRQPLRARRERRRDRRRDHRNVLPIGPTATRPVAPFASDDGPQTKPVRELSANRKLEAAGEKEHSF